MDIQDVLTLVTAAGTVVAIIASVVAMSRNKKSDAVNQGQLAERIEHISASVDEIKTNQRDAVQQAASILERLASVESSTKSAHHRIDNLENRLKP